MADYKYRRRGEGWSKKVDTAVLFSMNQAISMLRKLLGDKELGENLRLQFLRQVETLEENISMAYGKIDIIELQKEIMPEDTKPSTYRKNI